MSGFFHVKKLHLTVNYPDRYRGWFEPKACTDFYREEGAFKAQYESVGLFILTKSVFSISFLLLPSFRVFFCFKNVSF